MFHNAYDYNLQPVIERGLVLLDKKAQSKGGEERSENAMKCTCFEQSFYRIILSSFKKTAVVVAFWVQEPK